MGAFLKYSLSNNLLVVLYLSLSLSLLLYVPLSICVCVLMHPALYNSGMCACVSNVKTNIHRISLQENDNISDSSISVNNS